MNSFSIQAKIIDPQTKETIPTKPRQTKKKSGHTKKKKKKKTKKTNLRQKPETKQTEKSIRNKKLPKQSVFFAWTHVQPHSIV